MHIAQWIESIDDQEKEIGLSVLSGWNDYRNNKRARDSLDQYSAKAKREIYQTCKGTVEITKVIRYDKSCELSIALIVARMLVQDIEG